MRDLFGKPWDDVDVDDVERFLANAGDEGLLWEAKGSARPHPGSVRKAVSGFANALGGYYIVGAERADGDSWTLPGVEFGSDEPATWLSSVITAGVSPVPRFGDPKVFEREGGRAATVVRVEPVDVPPCLTSDGVVNARVSGQPLPVTDQAVLADLTQRGARAREQAETKALQAADRILDEHGFLGRDKSLFSLAICPVSGPDDRAALMFRRTTFTEFTELVAKRLQPDPVLGYGPMGTVHQDSLRAWPTAHEYGSGWTAAAYWTGAVAAVYGGPRDDVHLGDVFDRMKRAWKALAEANRLLGGAGETHAVVMLNPDHPSVQASRRGYPKEPVRRWTMSPEPSDDDIARVERELKRGFGETAWEPE